MNKKFKLIMKLLLLITIVMIICTYEVYISYNNLTVTNYNLNNYKISNKVNIVIISDLHDNQLGQNNKELIDMINKQSPDFILVVGDMVNSYSNNSKIVINFMKEVSKNNRVFYSIGNTEKDYLKKKTSNLRKELEDVGVTVLDNEYKDIKVNNTNIRIGGMFDYAFGLKNKELDVTDSNKKYVYKFLSEFDNTDSYKIMMSHRPDSFIFGNATKDWKVDLVVSGHTHGGQVRLPFKGGLYVSDQGWFPKYDKGMFDLNNTNIVITSGLGSGKQKIPRFNNVPEITKLCLEVSSISP